MEETIGMVDAIKVGTDFGAQPALRVWMLFVAGEGNRLAVADFGDGGAGVRTIVRASPAHELQFVNRHVIAPA
jgi:hypothetical protein